MKIIIYALTGILLIILFYWAIYPNYAPEWTGFGYYEQQEHTFREKKLWDWLQLLIIPGFLAIAAWILNKVQKQSESKLETDRQRQSAMESYFDKMTKLLLEEDLRKEQSAESRIIARTLTLGMFKVLDIERKAQVLQFIYELGLIDKEPIINLNGADLRGINLEGGNLSGSELRGINFENANLKNVNFTEADLRGSNFIQATFTSTNLTKANLTQAKLEKIKLENAVLEGTILEQTCLEKAKSNKKLNS
jgi:hypothetical protein